MGKKPFKVKRCSIFEALLRAVPANEELHAVQRKIHAEKTLSDDDWNVIGKTTIGFTMLLRNVDSCTPTETNELLQIAAALLGGMRVTRRQHAKRNDTVLAVPPQNAKDPD